MGMSADQLTYARMLLADPGSDAIQTLLIANAVGGTWTISFDGETTSALAFNAGSNVVQNALSALPNIGTGNVTVNNTAPYSVYFVGDLGHVAQPMLTADTSNLIGTNVSATVTQVAQGGVLAFSDSELDLLYSQAQANFYLAISYAYYALLGDLSRLHDYVAGQSQEKLSQVPEQIRKQAEHYQQYAFAGNQVQPVRLASVPPVVRAYPVQVGVPSLSLSTYPRPPWRRWGNWGNG